MSLCVRGIRFVRIMERVSLGRRRFLGLLAWLSLLSLSVQSAAALTASERALIEDYGFPSSQVGFLVFDLQSGAVLSELNPNEGFIPASTQKVPSLLYSLETLGPSYRFETELWSNGQIHDGILTGDLVLRGGGDPMLFNEHLSGLVRALLDLGVTEVAGAFLFDESALPSISELNPTQPLAATYNPGLSALSLNFNVVDLNWERDRKSGRLQARAVNRSDELEITADVIEIGTLAKSPGKEIPYLPRQRSGRERWLLSPDLPARGHAEVPVKQPALNAAATFRRIAAEQGLKIGEPAPGTRPRTARRLAAHRSDRLDEMARLIMRYSNNLSAELIAFAGARNAGAQTRDLPGLGREIMRWLRSRIPSADWNGLVLANASGLSSESRISPRQMAFILAYGAQLRWGEWRFADLLAPVKWRRDFRALDASTETDLEVRTKSGTIYYARAQAGYMTTASGRELGFALFITDAAARARFDKALDKRSLKAPAEASAWLRRARGLERELISLWLLEY